MKITSYSCQILLKIQIQKFSKIKFSEIRPMLPIQYNLSLKSKHLHLISIVSEFRRIQNLTPVFTIQSLTLL